MVLYGMWCVYKQQPAMPRASANAVGSTQHSSLPIPKHEPSSSENEHAHGPQTHLNPVDQGAWPRQADGAGQVPCLMGRYRVCRAHGRCAAPSPSPAYLIRNCADKPELFALPCLPPLGRSALDA